MIITSCIARLVVTRLSKASSSGCVEGMLTGERAECEFGSLLRVHTQHVGVSLNLDAIEGFI